MTNPTTPGNSQHPTVIGILGGMGPAATADFYSKLIAATPASNDQEHRRVVMWADPTVPDRSDALAGRAPDPTPWLVNGANILKHAGATVIAIPCNTAHAFVTRIENQTGVTVVHMINEVGRRLAATPGVNVIGLLATTGTVESRLYQDWLARRRIEVLTPDDSTQIDVMTAIREIKSGSDQNEAAERFRTAAQHLIVQGAQAIVAGCTEVPLGLRPEMIEVPLIDPATVLAEEIIRRTAARTELEQRP
jgi:aspartate racemase